MICDALNKRLLSVAELVRQDAIFADIGTDHAYLPLFLLKEGKIKKAYCSDINEGPLRSARINARDTGYEDEIVFTLADGADALAGYGITDYAICGMGGELIADIVDRAEHFKRGDINLILQPMTKPGHLRAYLATAGYQILCESYSEDAGKYYVAMLVNYIGKAREIDPVEAELGSEDVETIGLVAKVNYLKTKIRAYRRAADGKILGGDTSPPELKFIEAAEQRLHTLESLLHI